jgi:hypothetical protein
MVSFHLQIAADGRIAMPKACREALNLNKGDRLLVQIEDGEARLLSLSNAVKKAQAFVKQHKKNKKESLSEALIKMRREEAKRA